MHSSLAPKTAEGQHGECRQNAVNARSWQQALLFFIFMLSKPKEIIGIVVIRSWSTPGLEKSQAKSP